MDLGTLVWFCWRCSDLEMSGDILNSAREYVTQVQFPVYPALRLSSVIL